MVQCDWIVQTHKVYTLEASHQYTTFITYCT